MTRKRRRNLFIAIEGLSGVGKSTVVRILARKLRAKLYKTPSGAFAEARAAIDRSNPVPLSRFYFYLASIVQASEEIEKLLHKSDVVCDRYFLTTYCYHKALTSRTFPLLQSARVANPDFTFLIICKEKTRHKRLKQRGFSFNDTQERRLRIDQRFLKEYRNFHPIEIDNNRSPEAAAEDMLRIITGAVNR